MGNHKRFIKAALYRGFRWIVNMLLFWMLTGNIIDANITTLIVEVVATLCYVLYDKFWDDVLGKKLNGDEK